VVPEVPGLLVRRRRQQRPLPVGGGHDKQGSGDYYCDYGNPPGGKHQTGWRRCRKCYCCCYSEGNQGRCARGGYHDYSGSGNYYLDYQ